MDDPVLIEVDVRLRLRGEELTGEVTGGEGLRIAFAGWLGLIGAIESLQRRVADRDRAPR